MLNDNEAKSIEARINKKRARLKHEENPVTRSVLGTILEKLNDISNKDVQK